MAYAVLIKNNQSPSKRELFETKENSLQYLRQPEGTSSVL